MHRDQTRTGADDGAKRVHGWRRHPRERIDIRRVAREEFVAAISRQADRDVLARELGHVVGRNRGRVGKRLVVVHREPLGDGDAVGRDDLLVMIRVERHGGLPGVVQLVVGRIAEADRERVDRPFVEAGHQRENCRGVHAAAQECAKWNIRSQA